MLEVEKTFALGYFQVMNLLILTLMFLKNYLFILFFFNRTQRGGNWRHYDCKQNMFEKNKIREYHAIQ